MYQHYRDRQDAGKQLALALQHYADQPDVLILALPRGGVPVAFQVAINLHAPLDVFIVRKLGVPGHSELAFGAIATGNTSVLNNDIVAQLGLSDAEMQAVKEKEQAELIRRQQVYRGDQPDPIIENKTIILVDDGIATGASMRAAIQALRKLSPKKIVVAVPVAQKDLCDEIAMLVDELVCPLRPEWLHAVGGWYEIFTQTEDEEVFYCLQEEKKLRGYVNS